MSGAHSCSYHCERPECVRAQRDELREEVELQRALVAEAQQFAFAEADRLYAAVLAEREACAKVAASFDPEHRQSNYGGVIARMIRERRTNETA